ncbi:hypothetical protein DU80_07020 [Methanosarcina mazei]|uniref:SpoVT-AbrB domain-containing protein n=1 Tax=Methanosarcina mazei TaxID=2209 RepID=A0A0F8DU34_METMZ|nr:hypothetical protein DU47_12805 [Methanosarcina mazei]KKH86875.1 hypothetical protein DU80_07020 [Methanosarcina mazei]
MINFGQRSIFKQGGSFLISLPIQWVKSTNPANVKLEMDKEQRIIVTSVPAESCRARGTEEHNTN